MSQREFSGFAADQAERDVMDVLVERRKKRSRSDLLRTLIAEEARRLEVPVPAGALDARRDKRRTKIGAATRQEIVQRLDAGDRTGVVAAAFDIPSQTVSKIKGRACSTGNHHHTRHIS